METLVTGASGFVGSAVVRQLIRAGHKVRVLLRPTSDRRNVEGLPLKVVFGDLNSPASLESALTRCRALFHVAADYRLWASNSEELYQTNVQGTENVLRAAVSAGVERIVYTSSVATLGHAENRAPADENTPVELADMIGHYKRSKFLAEERVRRLVHEEQFPVVIVNPSAPTGPRDIKPTPTGRMVLDAARGRMPAYVDTGLNMVHVDDVGLGHLLAFENGRVGERYVLGGSDMTLKEILEAIAGLTGGARPWLRLPHGVLLPVAHLSEAWAGLRRGREPRVSLDSVRMAKRAMFYSSARAIDELGYRPRPVTEALRDAVSWFQRHGYCDD